MSDTIERDFDGVPWQEDEKLAAARAGLGEVAKESGALIRDYPELDCSDGAHPAWWRGEKYGFDECVRAVSNVLDGKDNGSGVASEPWEGVRRRLLALLDGAAKAKEMPETVRGWMCQNGLELENKFNGWFFTFPVEKTSIMDHVFHALRSKGIYYSTEQNAIAHLTQVLTKLEQLKKADPVDSQPLPTVSEWIAANVRNWDGQRSVWSRQDGCCGVNTLPNLVFDELPVDVDDDKPGPRMRTARYEFGRRDEVLAEVLNRLGLAKADEPTKTPELPTVSEWRKANGVENNSGRTAVWFRFSQWREARDHRGLLPDNVFDSLSGGEDRESSRDYANRDEANIDLAVTLGRMGLARPDVPVPTPAPAPAPVPAAQPSPQPGTGDAQCNPYLKTIRASDGPDKGKTLTCDIYDVLTAFGVTNVGQIQGLKKGLRGGRADKDWRKDMREAIHSFQRAIQIEEQANASQGS